MGVVLYFEFDDGTETMEWSFDSTSGLPIPLVGDCVAPEKGAYRVTDRTFEFNGDVMTVSMWCEKVNNDAADADSAEPAKA
jgi:hypothetical protein